jgi:hypothetical protein
MWMIFDTLFGKSPSLTKSQPHDYRGAVSLWEMKHHAPLDLCLPVDRAFEWNRVR